MTVSSIPVAAFRYAADGAQAVAETIKIREAIEALNDTPLDDVIGGLNDVDLSLKGLAEKAVGLVSAGAILGLAQEGIALSNELSTAAQAAGTTVEQLSKLKFVAEESDVSFEALTAGIRAFQDGISEAAEGEGTFAQGLADIGLSASALVNLDLDQQLALIAGAFEQVEAQTDRVRISQDLFKGSSQELILLLAQGKEGIEELGQRAEELGVVLDNKAAASIDRSSKALERFGRVSVALAARGVGKLLTDLGFGSGDEQLDTESAIKDKVEQIKQLETLLSNSTDALRNDRLRRLGDANIELNQLREKLALLKEEKSIVDSGLVPLSLKGQIEAPELLGIDDGSDAAREAERAAEQQRRLDERIMDDMILARQQLEEDFKNNQIASAREVTESLEEEYERRADAEENTRAFALAQEQSAQEQILLFRQRTVAASQVLLTAYGGKFAAIAKAILLIEKGKAIVEAFMATRVAIMKAFEIYGPTPIGVAQAAFAAVQGAIQIAAIAAQGNNLGGGGGSGPGVSGGGAVPIDPVTNFPQQTAQPFVNRASQTATQVIIQGSVFSSRETADFLIQEIRDAIDKRDVVIIGNQSRQAQEITQR